MDHNVLAQGGVEQVAEPARHRAHPHAQAVLADVIFGLKKSAVLHRYLVFAWPLDELPQ